MLIVMMSLYLKLLVLKQVNVVVVVTISIIHMQNYFPDIAKNVNVRAFNRMSRTNETRHSEWHETCEYKCRLDANVCNYKQRWNDDKCICESQEFIDKGVCDKGFIWNPIVVSVNVINHVMLVNV